MSGILFDNDSWRLYRRHKGLLLLVLPGVLFFLLFNYLPMLGLVIAFKDFRLVDGIMGSSWSGLDNFRRLFGGADFPLALRNTVTISLLRLCFGFFVLPTCAQIPWKYTQLPGVSDQVGCQRSDVQDFCAFLLCTLCHLNWWRPNHFQRCIVQMQA